MYVYVICMQYVNLAISLWEDARKCAYYTR